MKTLIILLTTIVPKCMVLGQSNITPKIKDFVIQEVTVGSNSSCEGDCPTQALSIDDNLNLKYFGGTNSETKGYYTSKVDKNVWDSVSSYFSKFIKDGIDTLENGVTDQFDIEIVIRYSGIKYHLIVNAGKIMRVNRGTGEMELRELDTFDWFFGLIKKYNLHRTDKVLKFDTVIQEK